jgi:hypothetical protein
MAIAVIKFDVDDQVARKKLDSLSQRLSSLDDRGDGGGQVAQIAADVTSVEGALTMLGATAPQVLVATKALQAVGTAIEWSRQAAEVQALEASFKRLSASVGSSGASILASMSAVASGMISDRDLMLAANSAMALGVADSAQEISSLLQIAIAKGAEFGVTPTQAFGDLINGLGRMSPEILNNIGIVIDADAAYAAYAATLGTTADKLDEQQKMQALVNATLAANPDAAAQAAAVGDSAAAAFARWDVSTKQFSETFGAVFLPAISGGLDLLTRFIDTIGGIGDALAGKIDLTPEEIDSEIGMLQAQIADLQNPDIYFQSDAIDYQVAGLTDQIRMLEQAKALLVGTTNTATGAATQFSAAQSAAAPTIAAVTQNLLSQAQAARTAIAATQQSQAAGLRSSLLGMAGDLGAGAALGQYKELNAELDARTQRMQTWGYTAEQIEFTNAAWIENTTGALREQTAEMGKLESAGVSAGNSIDSAFQSLESRVSGVLSQSLSLDVGVDPADFLPREDAINENARRLAAIMRDGLGDQEWLGEFKAEVPGIFEEIAASANPQQAAAAILQEFQAGLRPELLDKDAAKERIRQMILGEQSMAAMAGELAQELAQEMGISMPQALGAAQSALGGGEESGGIKAGLLGGLDAGGIATGATSKIAAAFKENEGAVRGSGGVVGAWWGEGFMATVGANVPPGLLDMLTVKLLPMIQAASAAATSATTPDGA